MSKSQKQRILKAHQPAHSVGFHIKNGINYCNFWTSCAILANFFFKCRLLIELSSCLTWNFRRWQMTCWGSLEGTKEVGWKNFAYFLPENVQFFLFLIFSRIKRLSFICLLKLSSWRFFGGSIDSLKYSSNIQWDFVCFFKKKNQISGTACARFD